MAAHSGRIRFCALMLHDLFFSGVFAFPHVKSIADWLEAIHAIYWLILDCFNHLF